MFVPITHAFALEHTYLNLLRYKKKKKRTNDSTCDLLPGTKRSFYSQGTAVRSLSKLAACGPVTGNLRRYKDSLGRSVGNTHSN